MKKYKIYARYITDKRLALGVYLCDDKDEDVIASAIMYDKNIISRIKQLYLCTLTGKKQSKEIVNILTHDGQNSILELKKKLLRLTFFIDTEGIRLINMFMPSAIVFLSLFKKEKARTPLIEIERACRKRAEYLLAKENGIIKIEVM